MGSVRVFISYAQEPRDHVEQVRQFWLFLRANGVDATWDLSFTGRREDWPLWMMEQIQAAGFVVVVASAAYRRRSERTVPASDGRGVQFEGAILRELLYADRTEWAPKLLPVILPGAGIEDVPLWLGPRSNTVYRVRSLTVTGAEALLRVILGRPRDPAPPLGPRPDLPARTLPAQHPPAGGTDRASRTDQLRATHRTWHNHPSVRQRREAQ